MVRLKIEYIPLEKLTPYEGNARKHGAEDLAYIENSVDDFGMCDPIGIWGEQNVIVEGHGRLMALQKLGYTDAPCIRLDHLSDDQRRRYALAHNKTAEMSAWDFGKLDEELAAADFDMSRYGFQMTEPIDIDTFFETGEAKAKEPKRITCPHCGEEFEV